MSATSVNGRGHGSADKPTTKELIDLAYYGPSIYLAGRKSMTSDDVPTSPPGGYYADITFPKVLPGTSLDYVVILTSQNAENVYISSLTDTEEGFAGFSCFASAEGYVHYLIVNNGVRRDI